MPLENTSGVQRLYIDVRPYAPTTNTRRPSDRDYEAMPLLHTLPKDTQESIMRYLRKQDRYMSLASALLKHVFIHRQARVPWDQVRISRTPKPHARPYWEPTADFGLEFNVSHQAGMVVLVGCRTDAGAVEVDRVDESGKGVGVRVGVDVACTNEGPRTPDLSSQAQLEEWVDVFSEMFGEQERFDMKYAPCEGDKTRRFYTYWALKEAYIKLVGEGLLADWLRQLEFSRVPLPKVAEIGDRVEWDESRSWTRVGKEQMGELGVSLAGEEVEGLDIRLEGFEKDFVVATMMKGVSDDKGKWKELDIFADIGPCATNRCGCLR